MSRAGTRPQAAAPAPAAADAAPAAAADLVGGSAERFQALSDGVFAVAMTLLVLDLRVPGREAVRTDRQLLHALGALGPPFAAYGLSFVLLGIFWLAHHTLLRLYRHTDRATVWIHLAFLFMVTVVPFSASVLAEHTGLRLAVGIYWVNILALAVPTAVSIAHAERAGLVRTEDLGQLHAVRRRLVTAQGAYALSALLCLVDVPLSIAATAITQVVFIGLPLRHRRGGPGPPPTRPA